MGETKRRRPFLCPDSRSHVHFASQDYAKQVFKSLSRGSKIGQKNFLSLSFECWLIYSVAKNRIASSDIVSLFPRYMCYIEAKC